MGKWLDQLRDAITGPVERPSRTVMADELMGAAPPELQDSHGGLGGLWSTLKRADQYFSDNIGRAAADPAALLMGAANNARETVTLPREAWEGTIDPRSDEGIRRAFDMAGNIGLSARGTIAALPAVAPEAGSIGMFIGRSSPMADQAALSRAQQLEAAGAHRDQIWKDTLWGRGADKEWRSEIDDRLSRINAGTVAMGEHAPDTVLPLSQMFHHPKAYEAYPKVGENLAELRLMPGQESGAYYPRGPTGSGTGWVEATSPTREGLRATTLHEIQHPIQEIEGFARGGDPDEFRTGAPAHWHKVYEAATKAANRVNMLGEAPNKAAMYLAEAEGLDPQQLMHMLETYSPDDLARLSKENSPIGTYKRLAAEVEARNTETRRDMTMAERRATPPWETEDVPRERQIVRR